MPKRKWEEDEAPGQLKSACSDSARDSLSGRANSSSNSLDYDEAATSTPGDNVLDTALSVDLDAAPESFKKQNSIAIVRPSHLPMTLMRYLQSMIPESDRKVAIVVVPSDIQLKDFFLIISASFDAVIHEEHSAWRQSRKKAVALLTIQTLHHLCHSKSFKPSKIHSIIFTDALMLPSHHDNYLPSSTPPRIISFFDEDYGHNLTAQLTYLDLRIVRVQLQGKPVPTSVVIQYDPIPSAESNLLQRLHAFDPSENLFRRHFQDARLALNELGTCAADLVWQRAAEAMRTNLLSIPFVHTSKEPRVTTMLKMHGIVKNWTYPFPNIDPSSEGFNVSAKVLRMLEALHPLSSPEGRVIVIVRSPVVAIALADLISQLGERYQHIRPCTVTGKEAATSTAQDVFVHFLRGDHNLLIITRSAVMLEYPAAPVVIWFDVSHSQTDYAYALSHLSGSGSVMVHMVAAGDDERRLVLSRNSLIHNNVRWRRWIETYTYRQLPPDVASEPLDPYHFDYGDDLGEGESIEDPVAGGKVLRQNAVSCLRRWASEGIEQVTFHYERKFLGESQVFVCRIECPGTSMDGAHGSSPISKAHAQQVASFEGCRILFCCGLLNYRHIPAPPQSYKGYDDPLPPMNESIKTRYHARAKPHFWNAPFSSAPPIQSSLHSTIIMILGASQSHAPMLILTRQPIPNLAGFNVYFEDTPARISLRRGKPFPVSGERLDSLALYTARIVRSIFNKPFKFDVNRMQYFFAPLSREWMSNTALDPDPLEGVSWWQVNQAGREWGVPLAYGPPDKLAADVHDAIVLDRHTEFTRRYSVERLRADLTPLSRPDPEAREGQYANFVEYCKAHRKHFDGLQDEHQAMIEVDRVPGFVDRLSTSYTPSSPAKSSAKYLIPELCVKFTIPASTFRTALLLPCITRRIDDQLLVKELNSKLFCHVISEDLLLKALTASAAGADYDYERLELFGDSFLKYAASIYVFVTNPTAGEGALHHDRQRIVSNRALLDKAYRAGIPAYIQAESFTLKGWLPPGFESETRPPAHGSQAENGDGAEPHEAQYDDPDSLRHGHGFGSGKKKRKKRRWAQVDNGSTHALGDKLVADVAEAIIGAAYLSGGRETALEVTRIFRLIPPVPLATGVTTFASWSDFGRRALVPVADVAVKLRAETVREIEDRIGHGFSFGSRSYLLAQALTHASLGGYDSSSYERLEFLGDAILEFMVIEHVFSRDETLSPGALTLLKGAMVSNSVLGAICVSSGLCKYLAFDSGPMKGGIDRYVKAITARQQEEDIAQCSGRLPRQFWAETGLESPKVLSDMMEALIGAVYVASSFTTADPFFKSILQPFYDKYVTPPGKNIAAPSLAQHPTKTLFEFIQAQGCVSFSVVRELGDEGPECKVLVHDVVLSSASDTAAATAARWASEYALDALEGDPSFLSRTCDCRRQAVARREHKLEAALTGFAKDDRERILTGRP